jgi:hypothetical protein
LLFSFLTSVRGGDEWLSRFNRFNPEKDAGLTPEPVWTFWRSEKFLTLPGFELRTVEPLGSRYNVPLSIELKFTSVICKKPIDCYGPRPNQKFFFMLFLIKVLFSLMLEKLFL